MNASAGLRTLAEIEADLSQEIPAEFLKEKVKGGSRLTIYSWITAQRFLTHLAPGWHTQNSVAISNERIVVNCRLCIPTADHGVVCRDATGDDSEDDEDDSPQEQKARQYGSPSTRAEGQAFKRAAARFGFGLYLREKGAPQSLAPARHEKTVASANGTRPASEGDERKALAKQIRAHLDKLGVPEDVQHELHGIQLGGRTATDVPIETLRGYAKRAVAFGSAESVRGFVNRALDERAAKQK